MKAVIKFKNKIIYLLLLAFVIVGVISYKDYGVSTDENTQRKIGVVNALYINGLLNHLIISEEKISALNNDLDLQKTYDENTLSEFRDRDYGPFFELILIGFEYIFKAKTDAEIYYSRHLVNFFTFIFGLFIFYKLIKLRFNRIDLALLGVIILFLTPRIFAHSFYNSKDIIFMVAMISSLYTGAVLLKKRNYKYTIIHGLTSAILITIRNPGLIIIPLTIGTYLLTSLTGTKYPFKWKTQLSLMMVFLISSSLGFFLFWPYLWNNPFDNFFNAVTVHSNFNRWGGVHLLFGNYYNAGQNPFYYAPIWISITTPVIYQVLFMIGIILLGKDYTYKCIKNRKSLFSEQLSIDILIVSVFLIPFFISMVFKPTLYNGWRHLFFIYPSIIYIIIYGLSSLIIGNSANRIKTIAVSIVLILNFIFILYNMIKIHPYQMTYFNTLINKSTIEQRFDIDYWGLSYKDGINHLIENKVNDSEQVINLYEGDYSQLKYNMELVDVSKRKMIHLTKDLNKSDIIIYHNNIYERLSEDFYIEFEQFSSLNRKDGLKLLRFYKRK